MSRDEHCKLLEKNGWTVICKDPFEIEKYENGVRVASATGQAAYTIAFHLEKDNRLPKELDFNELNKWVEHINVGLLKEILQNIPDDGKILVERVKDSYFEQDNWKVLYIKGESFYWVDALNKNMRAEIERRKNGVEPEYNIENPEELIQDLTDKTILDQFSPAWFAGPSEDGKHLMIYMHY